MSYSQAIERKRSLTAPISGNFKSTFWSCVVVVIAAFFTSCASTQPPNQPTATTSSNSTVVDESANNPPVDIDQKISKALDAVLDEPDFNNSRWGVAVMSLASGKLLYQRNGNRLFTPASNMKLYSTAVALDLLGADYRWRTSVYSETDPDQNGTIKDDLILYGRGAPDLTALNKQDSTNSIEELAKALSARGVKKIEGNIVGDESYFRGDPTGEGWQWNDLQWYFGAEASALSVNANSVEVSITPGAKVDEPAVVTTNDVNGYIEVVNNIITVAHGEKIKFGVKRGLSDNSVTVWGQYPVGERGYGATLSVHRPSLWAANIFKSALNAAGITVNGTAKYRDSKTPLRNRFNTDGKLELAFVQSKPLRDIIKTTNKYSVNLYAELLLRTLGREREPMLNLDGRESRELGDEELGGQLIKLWLRRNGANTSGLAIHDGSGLSRLDLVTPVATTQLLRAIRLTNSGEVFLQSLPIAATDGTLGGRLSEAKGAVFAKTGALTYDNSLSGYLVGRNNQVYLFSIICNDQVGPKVTISQIDRLVIALYREVTSPASPSPAGSKKQN